MKFRSKTDRMARCVSKRLLRPTDVAVVVVSGRRVRGQNDAGAGGEMLERDGCTALFGSRDNDVGPRLAFSTGSYYTLEFN